MVKDYVNLDSNNFMYKRNNYGDNSTNYTNIDRINDLKDISDIPLEYIEDLNTLLVKDTQKFNFINASLEYIEHREYDINDTLCEDIALLFITQNTTLNNNNYIN